MALAMAELPLQWAKGATARRKSKQKRAIARKSDGPGNDDSSGSSTDAQEESTIEQLEQRARNKRSSMPVDSKATAQASKSSRKRWEEMSGTEKLWDLWTRERGILWYLNRSVRSLSFGSSFPLVVGVAVSV